MARESKQKRDEKRFGKAERLADLIPAVPIERWAFPDAFRLADREHRFGATETISLIQQSIPKAKLVDATNVADYVYRYTMDEKSFDWTSLVVRPAFDDMFIEARMPKSVILNGTEVPCPTSPWLSRFGFYVRQCPAEAFLDHWREMIHRTGFNTAGGETGVILIPVTLNHSSEGPGYLGCSVHLLLDEHGTPTDRSISSLDKWHYDKGTSDKYKGMMGLMSLVPLYAMKFMNCKNVATNAVEPEPKLNRERRKAGLKPFLRYHTINIEPMKRVLKTEGNIESEGLKKALHICRGHFATYTEDKPLFGHFTGTVWKPAHVRGSAKQGVVVSDYNVKAPGPNT